MKRETKYRAKSIDNGDWCYGIIHNEGINLFPVSVDMETVGQFIGFLDTHKREIYEGDILRSVTHPDIIMVIVRDKNEASFMAKQITEFTDLDLGCHISQEWLDGFPKEIIGNIYDNPELLKTK